MRPFVNKARYPDLTNGYLLYRNRSAMTPSDRVLTESQYNRIVKSYCKELANRIETEGIADLPSDIGAIVAVNIYKKPVYDAREKKYRLARNIDWNATRENKKITYKDSPNTFGFVFAPKHIKKNNILRCFGFVANKALYKRMRVKYNDGILPFYLADKDIYSI